MNSAFLHPMRFTTMNALDVIDDFLADPIRLLLVVYLSATPEVASLSLRQTNNRFSSDAVDTGSSVA